MSIINLTPHVLNIHVTDGSIVTVDPSGIIARVATKSVDAGAVDGIPTFAVEYGEVEGLPPEGDDTLIVSLMVASAAPRRDVFSPGELVRDAEGRPVGCRGLKRSLVASGAIDEALSHVTFLEWLCGRDDGCSLRDDDHTALHIARVARRRGLTVADAERIIALKGEK